MKKILIFTPSFFPKLGGVERHVLETTNQLIKKGYSVKVLTEKTTELKKFEKKSLLRIYRFSYPKIKYVGLFSIWWRLLTQYYSLIKEADVIHIHDIFVWYLPFRLMFWRKPVVTTFHGWEGVFPLPPQNKFWRKLGVLLSSKTVAVGHYLEKHYHFKADHVIYGGVHLPKTNYQKKDLLLYVGRLDYDTGLPLLLQSLKNKPWLGEVVFCGDGVLKDQARLYGQVVGFKNPLPYLKKAKVVFAGGYLSILEAFAYRCLVVAAYNNPLKRDYFSLSPLGRFVQVVSNDQELTMKLNFLAKKNNFNQSKLDQAYSLAKEQSWVRVADLYQQIYQQL